MKSNPVYTPFTALALKFVGVIMILSSLFDYISLAIPPKIDSGDAFRDWQWVTTTQVVNQGIVPLVGIALLVIGYWIANSIGNSSKSSVGQLKLAFWLSSLLGLIFLLLVLLHTSNTLWRSSQNFEKIKEQATQLEQQLEAQSQQLGTALKQLKESDKRTQAEEELKQIEEAIEKGQVPANQLPQVQAQAQIVKNLLEASKENPDAAPDKFKEENLNKIRTQKLDAENQIKSQVWKPGIKTIINSLLLAIGYIAIGWTGLRSFGN